MTDDYQVEDQDVELHDDENEIMEAQGHDPQYHFGITNTVTILPGIYLI